METLLPRVRNNQGFVESFDKHHINDEIRNDALFCKQIYGDGYVLISEENIKKISTKVTTIIRKMQEFEADDIISTDTIRGLVVTELLKIKEHQLANVSSVIGLKYQDIYNIWWGHAFADNANINGRAPEAMDKFIAGMVSKKAIEIGITEEVIAAHLTGRLHIHDLDYFATRPFCNEHDLRYYLYYGLLADGSGDTVPIATPAMHAHVAILHAAKALGSSQQFFSGGQGYQNFLTFISPFLEGKSYDQIKQLMQLYIWEMSQMLSRGNQACFSTTQLTPGVPDVWRDVPVVFKGQIWDGRAINKKTGEVKMSMKGFDFKPDEWKIIPLRTYGEFEREVRLAFKAYTEIMLGGDAYGRPFSFPKYEIELLAEHFDPETWNLELEKTFSDGRVNSRGQAYIHFQNRIVAPCYKELWYDMCKLIARDGTPYIHNSIKLDKGTVSCYSCCAYNFESSDKNDSEFNDKLHFKGGKHFILGSLQVVTLNLVQAALEAGTIDGTIEHCKKSIKMAVDIFKVKKEYMSKQSLQFARQTPSDPNDMSVRAPPLWDEKDLPCAIGIVGLNEAVQILTGCQIHESPEAHKMAVKLLTYVWFAVREAATENNIALAFARTPAETTAQRFAICDLLNPKYHEGAKKVIKGDLQFALDNIKVTKDLPIFYTNGAMTADGADITLMEKIRLEEHAFSAFDGGNIFHIWLGEENPNPMSIFSFIEKLVRKTNIKYFTFTKEYSICKACNKMHSGLVDICPICESDDITQFSRVTGYIQAVSGKRISGWNAGKRQELKMRKKHIEVGNIETLK